MPTAPSAKSYFLVTSTQYIGEKKPVVEGYAKVDVGDDPIEARVPYVSDQDYYGGFDVEDRVFSVTPRPRTLKVEWGRDQRAVIRPGQTFQREFNGVTIRMHARQVDPNDTRKKSGDKRISPVAVRAMEKSIDDGQAFRDAFRSVRAIRNTVRTTVDEIDTWAGQIPNANKKLLAAAVAYQTARVTKPLKDAEAIIKALGNKKKLDGRALQRLRSTATDAMREAEAITEELESIEDDAFRIQGRVRVTTKLDDNGKIDHWLVRFENDGDQAFIGTAAFMKTHKNAGRGLESMAVPFEGSTAVQRIPFNGNYADRHRSHRARPGVKLRVAVRGLGWTELALPEAGTTSLRVEKFVNDLFSDTDNAYYFEGDGVDEKRDEKVEENEGKVKFYDRGKRWMPDDWEDRRARNHRYR